MEKKLEKNKVNTKMSEFIHWFFNKKRNISKHNQKYNQKSTNQNIFIKNSEKANEKMSEFNNIKWFSI